MVCGSFNVDIDDEISSIAPEDPQMGPQSHGDDGQLLSNGMEL